MTTTEQEAPVRTGQVNNLDEMATAPTGQAIMVQSSTLGNRTWVRQESGDWSWEGHTVPTGSFVGAVSIGHVSWHVPRPQFAPGQTFGVGQYTYVVHRVEDDGRALAGAWRADAWAGWDTLYPQFMDREDVVPFTVGERIQGPQVMAVLDALRAVAETQATRYQEMAERARAAETEAHTLRNQPVPPIPANLVEQLRTYAEGVGDSDLDSILNEWGIGRQETVAVTIEVKGYTDVTMSQEQAAAAIDFPGRYITDVEESCRVYWSREFTVVRRVDHGSCACEDVDLDDNDVNENLPDNYEEADIDSTECEND